MSLPFLSQNAKPFEEKKMLEGKLEESQQNNEYVVIYITNQLINQLHRYYYEFWGGRKFDCETEEKRNVQQEGVGGKFTTTQILL